LKRNPPSSQHLVLGSPARTRAWIETAMPMVSADADRSPARTRAWIETCKPTPCGCCWGGRPLARGRGLKHSHQIDIPTYADGRPLARGRGLKPLSTWLRAGLAGSPARTRAWIETWSGSDCARSLTRRPLARGRGLKRIGVALCGAGATSPARTRAWIETNWSIRDAIPGGVARSHAGVD